MVPGFTNTRANLTENIEVLNILECGEICAVESPAVDVLFGIKAESVYSHVCIIKEGIGEILGNCGVLGIEVNTVACH